MANVFSSKDSRTRASFLCPILSFLHIHSQSLSPSGIFYDYASKDSKKQPSEGTGAPEDPVVILCFCAEFCGAGICKGHDREAGNLCHNAEDDNDCGVFLEGQ